MTDEQFDDMAREALAFEAGPPNEATWNRVKPVRWTWLPSVPEILTCGCAGALALLFMGLTFGPRQEPATAPNPVIRGAMHDETRSVLASVTRIEGAIDIPHRVELRGSAVRGSRF